MQNEKLTFQVSRLKLYTHGFFFMLAIAVLLFAAWLLFSGRIASEDSFRFAAQVLLIIFFTMMLRAYFVKAFERITLKGSTLSITTGVFRKRHLSLELPSVTKVVPIKTVLSSSSLSKRPDSLAFVDEHSGKQLSVSASIFSLKQRRHLLQQLASTLKKSGVVSESDKPSVQWLLAGWDLKAPLHISDNVDEISRKVRRQRRILTVIVVVGVAPLVLLILLILLGMWLNQKTCEDLLQRGKVTTALIQTVEAEKSRRTPDEIASVNIAVHYTVEGKKYTKELRVSYDSQSKLKTYYEQIKNASTLQVRYLPDNPRLSDLATHFDGGNADVCKE